MAFQITPRPNGTGSASISANTNARGNSIVSVDWDHVTAKPAILSGFDTLAATGILAATDLSGGLSARTITGTANEITSTNGDGVSGNPTLSLPSALTFTGKTITGGSYTGATITSSTYNGNTWTAGTGILTIAAGKTATVSNTLTFSGTDGSSAAFGTGGTVAYQGSTLAQFAATTSAQLAGVISDETGSGSLVFASSPTLVTPTLGVATATSVNKVAFTAPATSATLTLIDGTTLTGPASSGTAMTLGNTETVTGVKTFGSAGAVGRLKIAGTTSGTTTLDASATASGTLTLPAATDTLVGKATTDTFTNKTFNSAGTGNTLQVSGVTVSAGQYPGETTTGSATAGNVGEYVESIITSGSATSLTTATAKTVTSISLTAGDWDIRINPSFIPAATTSVTQIGGYISLVNNTTDVTAGRWAQMPMAAVVSGGQGFSINVPPYRMSLSSTTTVYMVVSATFTVSTMTAWGIISARRVR